MTDAATPPPAAPRVREERPHPQVARIVLARPEARNAQDTRMLYELDDAYMRAMQDDDVRVVILAADGEMFSSGHDLRDRYPMADFDQRGTWSGYDLPGAEGWWATERELYVGLCLRWRDMPKPVIAAVHGKVMAAGLMLAWPCDLIVAADDTLFSDPVVAFGVNGHEYFVHPFELGPRKAKEMLFSGGSVDAEEARMLGMVNHVVPRAELDSFALDLARRIALRPTMGLKLAKQAVNQAMDLQGQRAAVEAAFSLHQLGHSHNRQRFGKLIDPSGVSVVREGR
ncbi:MAG: enoyl-CoA hydratase [Actinobacteria bacterium]|nr:enoyl-CoA hydratase [Actinomycetota bacterium]